MPELGEHNTTRRVRISQEQKVLNLLRSAHGEEVSALDVQRAGGLQYSRVVHALRSKGYEITNRVETKDGVRCGWFRLIVSGPLRTVDRTVETPALFAPNEIPARHRDDG